MLERKKWIDTIKGILIILVVIGHAGKNNLQDNIKQIIFSFHMPVFFMISGYLLKLPIWGKLNIKKWLIKKIKKYFIPYVVYFFICSLLEKNLNIEYIVRFIWGGKLLPGAFWYITVLFLSEIILLCIEIISSWKTKLSILAVLFVSQILYSRFLIPLAVSKIPIYFRFPWNADVSLIAVCFLAIGYYGKKHINKIVEGNNKYKNISIMVSLGIMIISFFMTYVGINPLYIDMKYSQYRGGLLVLLVPIAISIILIKVSVVLSNYNVLNFISEIGKISLIIMYIHITIKNILFIKIYGESFPIWMYIIVVIVISMLINKIQKILISKYIFFRNS